MGVDDFVGYIGDYRIHDSTIQEVRSYEKAIDVVLKTVDGEHLTVTFFGVVHVTMKNPIGMFLYAITELETEESFRKFVFVNWDEEDDACFEVQAENCNILG